MLNYIFRRLLALIPVLLIVSLTIFLLIHLVPGDPAAAMLGENATQEQIDALHTAMGLDLPLPLQYLRWMGRLLRGDLGTSYFMKGTVNEILRDHMVPTLQQTAVAVAFAALVGVPLGMIAAVHRGRAADRLISGFSTVGVSMPSFLMGLGLVLLFSVKLRLLPSSGYKEIAVAGWRTHMRYMLLPGIALGFIEMGLIIRMTRSAVLEILSADYMRRRRGCHRDDLQHPRHRQAHAQRGHAPRLRGRAGRGAGGVAAQRCVHADPGSVLCHDRPQDPPAVRRYHAAGNL